MPVPARSPLHRSLLGPIEPVRSRRRPDRRRPDRRSPTTRPVALIAAVTLAVGLGSIASTGAAMAAEPSVVMTNLPPIGQPDFYNTIENGTLTITAPGVLANDTDPNGDGITVAYLQTAPTHGMVSGPNIIGHFDYTPTKGFVGIDTFKYVITDGSLISAPITVSVHVIPLKPLAHNDSYVTDRNRTLDVPAPGLMKNDVDPNGYLLSMGTIVQKPKHGSALLISKGRFLYVPNPGFSGTDTFTYTVTSSNQTSLPATVKITVTANAKPKALNNSYAVKHNTKLAVAAPGVLGNDTDTNHDKLTLVAFVTKAAHGSLSGKAPGSFVYTPKKGFVGKDHFTYRVSDGHGGTAVATVNLTVK